MPHEIRLLLLSVDYRLMSKPLEIEFKHSTPRIYKTCILIQPQDEMGALTFESKLGRVDQQVFLATLTRLPTSISEYLSSSSLADIRKPSRGIWQLMDWLPSCMVLSRWTVHQLDISWSTLTHPPGKRYINSSCQMLQP